VISHHNNFGLGEFVQDGAKKGLGKDGRTQITHIPGENAIEFAKLLVSSPVNLQAELFSLANLISDLGREALPQGVTAFWEGKSHMDL